MRTLIDYVSLLRVPLFFFAIALAIPICAFVLKSTRPLLRGAFDLNRSAVMIAVGAAWMYSIVIALCAVTIIEGAPARTSVAPLTGWLNDSVIVSVAAWKNIELKNVWLVILAIASIPAVLSTVCVIVADPLDWAWKSGIAFATLAFLGWLAVLTPFDYWTYEASTRFLAVLFRLDPAGYLTSGTGPETLGRFHVYSTHTVLLIFVQFAIYLGIILVCIQRKRHPPQWLMRWDNFPALYSVYYMLSLLCLLLSALGFYLDRYGFSLVFVLIVWRVLVSWLDQGHTVGFWRPVAPMPTPREVLAANSWESGGKVIVACASGGGIHAAAWTSKVLTGLEEIHQNNFGMRLRVISSVSGGSVGAMNFAGAYGPFTGLVSPELRDYANTQSRLSSLPAAIGGWFLFDLPRLFWPWLPSWLNRGWALERRWDLERYWSWALSLWGVQAWLGRRPAVLFNCTAVETGSAVVFGSSKLRSRDGKHKLSFHKLTGYQVDVLIPTAARLSATFPLVSPASRIHQSAKVSPDYSYVDGGYYDNFGVTTALEFLDQALGEQKPGGERPITPQLNEMLARLSPPVPIREVLLIEIRAAATSEVKLERVFFEQIRAPARALLAVRSAAQRLRNDTELRLAREAFGARGVVFKNVVFEYPADTIPLSWHLTAREQACIDDAWLDESFAAQKAIVAEFCKEDVLPLPDLQVPEPAAVEVK